MDLHDTICALSTPPGMGAIALLRISGNRVREMIEKVFIPRTFISSFEANRVYLGEIKDGETLLDEVLVTFFQHPHSYTGEDLVEISCHGSTYIQRTLLELMVRTGCRLAEPGEFTMRAFVNGKMDLSQAEAVGDLIASQSKAAHQVSMQNLRGGFSMKIKALREQLVHFAALMELELDFGEEDVAFANRKEIHVLMDDLKHEIETLIHSFALGNVFKNGIPVAIVGKPNVGKSTLLNALLNEDRAIVSDIPGTTRDTIEDSINIHGFMFRFIDTAGLRATTDEVEKFGIERSYKAMDEAMVVLYMVDKEEEAKNEVENLKEKYTGKMILVLVNKSDLLPSFPVEYNEDILFISAKKNINIFLINSILKEFALSLNRQEDVLVSNARHYEALLRALDALQQAEAAFKQQVSTEFVMIDIKQVLYFLGSIVGEISNDEVLGSVFSRFCIGK